MVDDSYRYVSGEACARALTEAAEAVASEVSETSEAIIISLDLNRF